MQKGCLDETTLLFEGTTPRFVQAMQQIFLLDQLHACGARWPSFMVSSWTCCDFGWIQTIDLRTRSALLCSAELRSHCSCNPFNH